MQNPIGLLSRATAGLRFRLLLLVVLACTPLIALTLHTTWEDRRRATNSWRQRSQKLAQSAAREEEKLLGGTQQLLLALAESAPVRAGNSQNAKRLLDHIFTAYPRYANLGVLRTDGSILASAVPFAGPANLAGRDFFRRVMEIRAFAVGKFPSKRTLERPTLSFGYPVLDSAGQVKAVVFAALDLDWFNRFGSELPSQIPKGATWTEVDTNGAILVRYPGPEAWIGRYLPEKELLAVLAGRTNGIVEVNDAHGVPAVYAVTSFPSQLLSGPTMAILGTPRQTLFAEANRALFRNLEWLGLAAGLALLLGWIGSDILILRPVKALVRSSIRLASGDLSARSGLRSGRDELGLLTQSFDQMAEALEQRELERQRSNYKLQVLSHRLVEVQESERRHIARELHDEIGQALTAAEMNLQAALQCPSEPAVERRLVDSIQAVEQVLEQVHDLSLNLRPSMLDDLGLESAIRWYTQRQAALAGVQADFHADPLENRLDPMIETGCFRIAQEALTNIVRHAKARTISVELTRQDSTLHLLVRDDGIGFEVPAVRDEAVRGASLGLLSMEERASLAGGGLEFNSSPGRGTEIHAWFPLKWRNSTEPAA